MKWTKSILVGTASAAAIASLAVSGPAAADVIKFGAAASITGDWAPYQSAKGMKCMAEILNDQGGVDGHTFEVTIRDNRSDPQLAVTLAQEFLDEGVMALDGTPASDSLIPIAQLATPQGVIVYAGPNTQVEMFVIGETTYMTAAVPDPFNAAAGADHAYKSGARTALLMTSKDWATWTEGLPIWFGMAFERHGGKVLGQLNHSVGTTDWSPQIAEIKAMDPLPDVIFMSSINPDVGIFIRQLRAAGIQSKVYGSDGFDDPTLQEVAGGAPNVDGSVFFATHGHPEPGSTLEKFYDDCVSRGYEINGSFFGLGGDVIKILAQGVHLAGSTDPVAVRKAIFDADELEGMTSDTYVYKGGPGYPVKKVAVIGFKNGERVLESLEVPEWVPEFTYNPDQF